MVNRPIDNHEFKGSTREALRDIRDDIKEIKGMIKELNDKVSANMQTVRDRCEGYRLNIYKDYASLAETISLLSTQVLDIDRDKSGITKIKVAMIAGVSSVVGAALGGTGILLATYITNFW